MDAVSVQLVLETLHWDPLNLHAEQSFSKEFRSPTAQYLPWFDAYIQFLGDGEPEAETQEV